jgi:hypothetical protein
MLLIFWNIPKWKKAQPIICPIPSEYSAQAKFSSGFKISLTRKPDIVTFRELFEIEGVRGVDSSWVDISEFTLNKKSKQQSISFGKGEPTKMLADG